MGHSPGHLVPVCVVEPGCDLLHRRQNSATSLRLRICRSLSVRLAQAIHHTFLYCVCTVGETVFAYRLDGVVRLHRLMLAKLLESRDRPQNRSPASAKRLARCSIMCRQAQVAGHENRRLGPHSVGIAAPLANLCCYVCSVVALAGSMPDTQQDALPMLSTLPRTGQPRLQNSA